MVQIFSSVCESFCRLLFRFFIIFFPPSLIILSLFCPFFLLLHFMIQRPKTLSGKKLHKHCIQRQQVRFYLKSYDMRQNASRSFFQRIELPSARGRRDRWWWVGQWDWVHLLGSGHRSVVLCIRICFILLIAIDLIESSDSRKQKKFTYVYW